MIFMDTMLLVNAFLSLTIFSFYLYLIKNGVIAKKQFLFVIKRGFQRIHHIFIRELLQTLFLVDALG